jgi:hypothetical protein
MYPILGIAAAILIAISIYPLISANQSVPSPQLADRSDADMAPAESLLRSLPPAPASKSTVLAEAETVAPSSPGEQPWDNGRDLRQLARRIAALRTAGIDAWDGQAVPLEMLPTDAGPTGLLPAGNRRPQQ